MERVVKGFEDLHPGVRNGALFALGQFSEHLQPGIVKYANELVPLLLNFAIKVRRSEKSCIDVFGDFYLINAQILVAYSKI